MKTTFIYTLPEGSTWDHWLAQLIHDFSEQHIAALPEDQWREAAQGLATNGFWGRFNPPSAEGFERWQDWASAFILSVNGP